MDDNLINNVGNYCKNYRLETLKLSLKNFSINAGLNNKNVNAFEFGRANNIEYLFYYYKLSDERQRKDFARGLFKIL